LRRRWHVQRCSRFLRAPAGYAKIAAMGRSPVFRLIRVVTSVMCLIGCGLLVVLWGRSYYVEDRATGHFSNSFGVRFYSSRGWLVCCKNSAAGATQNYPWSVDLGADFWLQPGDSRLQFSLPIDFIRGSRFASGSIPHWFLALVSGILAAVSWADWRCRFSLRTLLVATTLVAMALGLAVAYSNG